MRTRRSFAAAALCAAVAALGAFAGCSELRPDLPAPTSGETAIHPGGWTDPSSEQFHGRAIAAAGWQMESCQSCHGPDYAGGVAAVSCLTCHDGGSGPENCSTCHGGPDAISPPEDLAGNTSRTARGVGGHVAHVTAGRIGSSMFCADCHVVPGGVGDPGHIDSPAPAEVPLPGEFGRLPTPGITPDPSWDGAALRCDNTFCHGNFRAERATSPNQFGYADSFITGSNYSPLWTGGAAEADCGRCHGLPPDGHIPSNLRSCWNCHPGVVDELGNIEDKSLHINGRINVLNTERSFR